MITRGRLISLVVVAIGLPSVVHAVLPLGYHRRIESGWHVLAVRVPIPGYTACLMNPPPELASTAVDPVTGDVRARHLAEHMVLRLDGTDPDRTISGVLQASRGDASASEDSLDEASRHLLTLAGMRWPHVVGDQPPGRGPAVLLLAGDEDPGRLMERLLMVTGDLPPAGAGPVAGTDAAPLAGWWRHVERPDSADAVLLGLRLPDASPSESAALRLALRALMSRLERITPDPVRRDVAVGSGGWVEWFHWSAPADSLPVFRDRLVRILEDLRRDPLPGTEFTAHRDFFQYADATVIRKPDRWFADLLLDEAAGRLPESAYEVKGIWESLDPERVRQACLTLMPRAPIEVSLGALPPGCGSLPVELWSGRHTLAEGLAASDRAVLIDRALRRMEASVWGGSGVEAVVVVGDWSRVRNRARLSGRLVETLGFPDGIRREFHPSGAGLSVTTWVSDGDAGAAILGVAREPDPDDIAEVRDRLRADPWTLVWGVESGTVTATEYGGGTLVDERVFQKVTLSHPTGSVIVLLDPDRGVPARVVIDPRGPGEGQREYRYHDYVLHDGRRYPGRIERYSGPRRQSILDVREVTPSTRLAAPVRLE